MTKRILGTLVLSVLFLLLGIWIGFVAGRKNPEFDPALSIVMDNVSAATISAATIDRLDTKGADSARRLQAFMLRQHIRSAHEWIGQLDHVDMFIPNAVEGARKVEQFTASSEEFHDLHPQAEEVFERLTELHEQAIAAEGLEEDRTEEE